MHRAYPMIEQRSMLLRLVGIAVAIALVMLVTDLGGAALRRLFLLENDAVLRGELWRLVTAHLVNLSRVHTHLNILGLGLILVSLWSILTPRMLARAILLSGAAISLGWLALMPAGVTYVGFSGITHGVMTFGGLVMLRTGPRWFGGLILACVAAKLGQEFFNGAVPGADAAIGGRVSFVSHTLGTLGGALAAREGPVWPRLGVGLVCLMLSLIHAEREAAALPAAVTADG